MTEPLSSAAQAVMDATGSSWPRISGGIVIAAALRAAADQVVPEECLARFPNDSEWQDGFTDANSRIRSEILAIAAELDL
jgi:hypothetical protein